MSVERTRFVLMAALAAALTSGAMAASAAAQTLTGRVLHDGTGRAIEGARITLLDAGDAARAETFTDASGAFRIPIPAAGTWRIRAELLGFASVRSGPVVVVEEERLYLEVRMDVEAIAIAPVIVRSRSSTMRPAIQDFYGRVEDGRLSGLGQYVTREEVKARSAFHASDLLRSVNGVRVITNTRGPGSTNGIRMSRGCVPSIYVDGAQINGWGAGETNLDEYVTATAIEGIEVYRGAGRAVDRYHDERGCGLILVWTRRDAGPSEARPFSLARLAAGAGLVLGLLLLN